MNYLRQLALVAPEDLRDRIHVIGCGGIGSMASFAVAKLGCTHVSLYDHDTVSDHNLPSQLFRREDVGQPKPVALAATLREFAAAEADAVEERVGARDLDGLVVVAVDSMAARRDIWERSVRLRPRVKLLLDARMGAEVCRLYAIAPCDPDQIRFYESTLYADDEADPEPCTRRAVVYNTLAIGALVAVQVKKFARKEPLWLEIVFDLQTLTVVTR